MKAIATVINNNQPGWTNIIETAPNVTLDIGTKLYTKEPKLIPVGYLVENEDKDFSFHRKFELAEIRLEEWDACGYKKVTITTLFASE